MWRVWERTERERQQMSDARGREWRRKSRVSLVLLSEEKKSGGSRGSITRHAPSNRISLVYSQLPNEMDGRINSSCVHVCESRLLQL